MKIASVAPVGKKKVYDLSVEDVEHYVLENGIVTHNTGVYYSADNIFIIAFFNIFLLQKIYNSFIFVITCNFIQVLYSTDFDYIYFFTYIQSY